MKGGQEAARDLVEQTGKAVRTSAQKVRPRQCQDNLTVARCQAKALRHDPRGKIKGANRPLNHPSQGTAIAASVPAQCSVLEFGLAGPAQAGSPARSATGPRLRQGAEGNPGNCIMG